MSLPQLNEHGHLPPGIHDASLDELTKRFGQSSRRRVQRVFGFDLFAVRPNSIDYNRFVEFFSQVRNHPGLIKGLVRVQP